MNTDIVEYRIMAGGRQGGKRKAVEAFVGLLLAGGWTELPKERFGPSVRVFSRPEVESHG